MPIGSLLPPLVDKIRRAVQQWRDDGYEGASDTSMALLRWWFCRDPEGHTGLRYYFCQREAVETVIYLYEVAKARDKFALLPFSSGGVAPEMMDEDWARYVVKMATGSGKTKVAALVILWSYFHKCYEADSGLSRNILLIAPNIIVLDRLKRDFEGLRIFYDDGALPDNGHEGRDWQNDFRRVQLHVQDEVRVHQPVGNIFLTNIHRVFTDGESVPSPDDDDTTAYFLGQKPTGATTDSKVDLGAVVRDIDEIMVINDEAHHIHDSNMAWFRSIEDISNHLVQKDRCLSLQVDLTATPKHNNGAIFVQTVSDYPLVEAIHQGIVKRPVVPDNESAGKLRERQCPEFAEQYADYINLGVEEWRKARDEHKKAGKKAVLFVMTDNTRNCDELAEYLQNRYRDLEGRVLTIHTKRNGEIDEKATGKKLKELQELRASAANIDEGDKYHAVVSVLVLREGWDVRNVTTIVGLRAYSSKSNILPEQTLGRGLRLMYGSGSGEKVSVIGSPAFVDFVKRIEKEGIKLERAQMGPKSDAQAPLIIVAREDDPELDLQLPLLSRHIDSDYDAVLDIRAGDIYLAQPATYKKYGDLPRDRKIVFCDILTGEIDHSITLSDDIQQDYSNVIAWFARRLLKQFKMFSNYPHFYELTESFVQNHLFGKKVQMDAVDTLRNLAESATIKKVMEAMGSAINAAIHKERGGARIKGDIKVSAMRPFPVKRQDYYEPRKSLQNMIVADGNRLELDFARFLDSCPDVRSFAKNYFAVRFSLEYADASGNLRRYFPDFLVRDADGKRWVIETKGRMDDNDKLKFERLHQWCDDVNRHGEGGDFGCLLVMEKSFREYTPKDFRGLTELCRDATDSDGR